MRDVTPNNDGGVMKRVIRIGLGRQAKIGDFVKCHYECRAESSEVVFDDSQLRGQPLKQILEVDGKNKSSNMLPGVLIALLSMRLRERSEFIIQPKYMFGEEGVPPRIPPNERVSLKIDMVELTDKKGEDDSITTSTMEQLDFRPGAQQYSKVLNKVENIRRECKEVLSKQDGNVKYAFGRYCMALRYLQACKVCNDDEQEVVEKEFTSLYINMANCFYRMGKYGGCIGQAKRALRHNYRNAKAHYWLGKCYTSTHDYELAQKHLRKALALKPGESDVTRALSDLKNKQNLSKRDEYFQKGAINFFKSNSKVTSTQSSNGLPLESHQPVSSPSHQPVSSPSHQPVSSPSHQPVSSPSHQLVSSPSHQPVSSPCHQPVSSLGPQPSTGARKKEPTANEMDAVFTENLLENAEPSLVEWVFTEISALLANDSRERILNTDSLSQQDVLCVVAIAEKQNLEVNLAGKDLILKKV